MRSIIAFFLLASPVLAVPDGFEITTFAEPFDIEYPTALSAAGDGTVYVSVDQNGSLGKEKGKYGKIVTARDTDGDGKADRFATFVEQVDSPRGGHFVRDTFYLVHPPFVSAYRDTTGDGVADEHKVLLRNLGFGLDHPRGSDHTTNGLRMGIDGWLYIAVGDFGMEGTTGTDGREVTLHGGGVARVRPDGSQLEVYSYYLRNICDVAISPYLDIFMRDNTNDGKGWNIRVHHCSSGSDHGYPRLYKNFADEAVKPMLDLGGGSGTGALYLHEPGFPGDYGDKLLTCDWTTGHIYEHGLEPFEATFKATEGEFMKLGRAIDVDVDGESRLYVCDWRGGGFKFGGKGKKVGLVQQIVPKGYEAEKWPDLTKVADSDLVKQLAHRSAVRRIEAQREVLARGPKELFAKELFALIKDDAQPLFGRVAAIFTFKQLYGSEANKHLAELAGPGAVREFVLRAIADRKDQLAGVPASLFIEGMKDPNPRVQLQAVVGAGRLGNPAAAGAILAVGEAGWKKRPSLGAGEDLRIPHACVHSLVEIGAIEACLQAMSDSGTRPLAVQALQRMHDEDVVNGLGEILTEAGDDDVLRFDAMAALARLHYREGEWDKKAWWGTRPDDRGPYFLVVEWDATSQVKAFLESGFPKLSRAGQTRMLEILAKNRIDVAKLNLGDQDPVQLALGSPTVGEAQLVLLTNAALDPKRPWEERLDCYRALGRGDAGKVLRSQVAILAQWLGEKENAAQAEREVTDFITAPALILQLRNLRQIARKESQEMSRVAWRAILSFAQSPLIKERFRADALKMAQDNPREEGFFLALADLKLAGFDKQIDAAIGSDNDTLIAAAERARKVIGAQAVATGKKVGELDAAEVTQMAMTGKGDPARGAELYQRQGCIACHAVDQEAVQKGPYLGSAGSKFTRDYLIESILNPNAIVAQGFQTELITMKDGSAHLGFVTKEEDGVIEIRNIAGIATNLKGSAVAKREQQANSMMPPGLAATLTGPEFVDLVEYLGSLRE